MKKDFLPILKLIHKNFRDIRITSDGFITYCLSVEQVSFFHEKTLSERVPILINEPHLTDMDTFDTKIDKRHILSVAETRHAIYSSLINGFQKEIKKRHKIIHKKAFRQQRIRRSHVHPVEYKFVQEIKNVQDLFHKNITILMLSGENKEPNEILNGETLEKALHHYRAALQALSRRSRKAMTQINSQVAIPLD